MSMTSAISALSDYIRASQFDINVQSQHQAGVGAIYELEQKLKSHYSKKYALCFCNATTALHAIGLASGLTRSSELITSPINWGGSVGAILASGCMPVFVSVEPDSLCLNPGALMDGLTGRTKVVLSVDYGGLAGGDREISSFCRSNGLLYISDSSQSLGATSDGKPAGCHADVIVTSFAAGKSLFGGEGGAVVTDDQGLYGKLLRISQHPLRQKRDLGLSAYNLYGPLNGRMNPLAAILINEMFEERFTSLRLKQNRYFAVLSELIRKGWIEPIRRVTEPANSTFHHLFLKSARGVSTQHFLSNIRRAHPDFRARECVVPLIPEDPCFRIRHPRARIAAGIRSLVPFIEITCRDTERAS